MPRRLRKESSSSGATFRFSKTFVSLCRGQVISCFIAGTGIFATLLSSTTPSTNFPMLMSFLNYTLLSTYLLRPALRRLFFHPAAASTTTTATTSSSVVHDDDANSKHQQQHAPRFSINGDDDEEEEAEAKRKEEEEEATEEVLAGNAPYFIGQKDEEEASPPLNTVTAGSTSKTHTWLAWYFLAAVLDVEANFLVINAYNYTSITSIMLLDCFTIPCAMVLSYFFLHSRYKARHIVGILICLLGLVCIVISDLQYNNNNSSSDSSSSNSTPSSQGGGADADTSSSSSSYDSFIGDLLTLAASALYACSNVLQEKLVKFNDREEYMGVVGAFGMLIAALQGSIVDLPGMRCAKFTPQVVASIAGFVSCLFFMYTNTSSFLQEGDSILFNLSLLTSDVYAVLFSFLLKGYLVPWMYFLAFALVASGLGLYYSEKLPVPLQSQSQATKLSANEREGNGGGRGRGGGEGRDGATMAREEGEEEEEEEEQEAKKKTSTSTLISLVSGAGNDMADEGTYSPLRSDDRSPPSSPLRR